MGGLALTISGDLQQLLLTDAICAGHLRNGELALGQRTGLIESCDLRLGQQLQIVAALHQNTVMAQPIPEKKLSGTEITSAQGQEITRNANAL